MLPSWVSRLGTNEILASPPTYNRDMKTKQVVALFLAAFLFPWAPSLFCQSEPSRQQIESHSHKAAEYLKDNRPDLAIPEFRAVVALDPSNVDARGSLGVLLSFLHEQHGTDEAETPEPKR